MKRISIVRGRHAAHHSATIYRGLHWASMSTGVTFEAALANAVAAFRNLMRTKRKAGR